MDTIKTVALLIAISALLAYIGIKIIKIPYLISLVIVSLLIGFTIWACSYYFQMESATRIITLISNIKYSIELINAVICITVFAGAFRSNIDAIKSDWVSVVLLGVFGKLLFVILTGFLFWLLFIWLHIHQSPVYCFLFATLIAPNEPLPILSIVNKLKLHPIVRPRIVSEALFSKGIALILFLLVFEMVKAETEEFSMAHIGLVFSKQLFGGMLVGAVIGFIGYHLMKLLKHTFYEIFISLVVFSLCYTLSSLVNVSGPLCMLVGGMFVGKAHLLDLKPEKIMRSKVRRFWEVTEYLLYIVLFALLGLSLVKFHFTLDLFATGLFGVLISLAARFLSIKIPSMIFNRLMRLTHEEDMIIIWSMLKGILPVLMIFLLTTSYVQSILIHTVYVVVTFSIIVEGLFSKKLMDHWVDQGIY